MRRLGKGSLVLGVVGLAFCVLCFAPQAWIHRLHHPGDRAGFEHTMAEFRVEDAEFERAYDASAGRLQVRERLLIERLVRYGEETSALQAGPTPQPERAIALLRQGLESQKIPAMRASLFYYLGQIYQAKADDAWRGPSRERARLSKTAQDQYENALAERADVPLPDMSLRARILEQKRLYTNSGVGQPAPEIDGPDLFGRRMRLSDYRGKLIALYFWGLW